MRPELETLWARLAANEALATEELALLEQAVAADESLRAEVLADARIGRLIEASQRSAQDAGPFTTRVTERLAAERDARRFVGEVQSRIARVPAARPQRFTRKPAVFAAFGVAVALAAVVAFRIGEGRRHDEPTRTADDGHRVVLDRDTRGQAAGLVAPASSVARLAEVQGSTFVVQDGRKVPAVSGAEVFAGQAVMTSGRNAVAQLSFPDGSEAELGGDSFVSAVAAPPTNSGVAAAPGVALFLVKGSLRADRTGRVLPFVVGTPHAEVQGLGARFAVSADTDATKLRVTSGHARVIRTGGGVQDVQAGQSALVEEKGGAAARALPPGGLAILVAGGVDLEPGDTAIKRRLEELGFEVRVRYYGTPLSKEVKYADLFVVSSTIESPMTRPELRDVAVPLLCWEGSFFDELGMTTATDQNVEIASKGELLLRLPGHLLAAGLSGLVKVLREPANLHWGRPGPLATWIAEIPAATSDAVPRAAIFGYERNVPMVGLVAPARRVGFFLDDETPINLNESGWALFDASVRWLTEPGTKAAR